MSTVHKQRADVIARREGDCILAFGQSDGGQIIIMNETAAFIWEHCTGESSAEDIAILVRQHFDLPEFSAGDGSLVEVICRHLDLMHKAKLVDVIETEKGKLESTPSGNDRELE
jgi:alpha-tubulin suppressor-like RCC1 family protein